MLVFRENLVAAKNLTETALENARRTAVATTHVASLAHLGGALAGFLYVRMMTDGFDSMVRESERRERVDARVVDAERGVSAASREVEEERVVRDVALRGVVVGRVVVPSKGRVAGLEAVAAEHRIDVKQLTLERRWHDRRGDRAEGPGERAREVGGVKDEAPPAARDGVAGRDVEPERVEA